MKTIKLISVCGVSILITMLCLQAKNYPAGTLVTSPAYDPTNYNTITVGPDSTGNSNILFTATCTDSVVHIEFGTCTNATTPLPSFTKAGTTYTATLQYPSSQEGNTNMANVVITTNDPGPCTTLLWLRKSAPRRPLADFCFAGNCLSSLMYNVRDFFPDLAGLKVSLTSTNNESTSVKSTTTFKVIVGRAHP